MAIDALAIWNSTYVLIKLTGDSAWASNFADWYAARIVSMSTTPTVLNTSAGFTFTFNKALFISRLKGLSNTSDASAGISKYVDCWGAAMTASTVLVKPGAFVPPSTPPTTFASVVTATIIASSVTVGKAKITALASGPNVSSGAQAKFAEKFREATLQLKIKVVGINGKGDPLTVDNVPLL